MTLRFRNVTADPLDPVETWPYEALVTALERGGAATWGRIRRAVRADPWGPVARSLDDYLAYADAYGVVPLMRGIVDSARRDAEASERNRVATRVRELVATSGLTAGEFAGRIGSSASRLSTYASGKVVPSAALMLRMERVAIRLSANSAAWEAPGWKGQPDGQPV